MAVGSFKKSSGIVALAIGLAMSLPAVASAQERQRSAWQQQQGGGNRAEARAERRSERAQARVERRANRAEARVERRSNRAETRVERRTDRAEARQQRAPQVQNRVRWGSREAQGYVVGGGQQNAGEAQRRWDRNRDRARDDRRDRDGSRWSDNDRRHWDNDRRHWDNDRRHWNNDNRRWNNNWRRDNRYNWHSYRNSHRDVFRMGRYYSPYRNYNYRRLSIGISLQPLFYSNRYWINDPWQYRLPEVYGPYRWVRYYDDALLVDVHTGRVVDAIHDFFW